MSFIQVSVHGADYEVEYNYYRGFGGSCYEPPEPETWEIESIKRVPESTSEFTELELEDLDYYEKQPDFEDKIIDAIIYELRDY